MSFWHSIFKTSDTSAVDVLYLQRWNFYTSTSNVNLCCIGHVYNWPFLKHQSSLAQYLYLYRDFKNIHIILKNKHVLIWRRPAPWFLLTTKWQNEPDTDACGQKTCRSVHFVLSNQNCTHLRIWPAKLAVCISTLQYKYKSCQSIGLCGAPQEHNITVASKWLLWHLTFC